jgi:hypothetical protein
MCMYTLCSELTQESIGGAFIEYGRRDPRFSLYCISILSRTHGANNEYSHSQIEATGKNTYIGNKRGKWNPTARHPVAHVHGLCLSPNTEQ